MTDPSTVPAPLTKERLDALKTWITAARSTLVRGGVPMHIHPDAVAAALLEIDRLSGAVASLEARCEESDSQDLLALKQRKVFCSTDGFWRSLHSADIYNSADEALTARRDYLARASRSQPVPNDG